jgi:hypothetical protein
MDEPSSIPFTPDPVPDHPANGDIDPVPAIRRFTQADRLGVFGAALDEAHRPSAASGYPEPDRSAVVVARKTARVLAIRLPYAFEVATDRGLMVAEKGDWLVTNHPDDDYHSDLWAISNDRWQGTYELVNSDSPRATHDSRR